MIFFSSLVHSDLCVNRINGDIAMLKNASSWMRWAEKRGERQAEEFCPIKNLSN